MMDGLRLLADYFDRAAQHRLMDDVAAVVSAAPFFRPSMPGSGRPFSVEMTNAGSVGWVSDRSGYRYADRHPVSGRRWPGIPDALLSLWRAVADYPADPECCLVNLYRTGARMGLHQDRDERTFDAPVVSVSLGDSAVFRIGGAERRDPTRSVRLHSGAVVVLGGPARLAFHGIDRILPGTSRLVDGGGRINLTLRRVTPPGGAR